MDIITAILIGVGAVSAVALAFLITYWVKGNFVILLMSLIGVVCFFAIGFFLYTSGWQFDIPFIPFI